MTMQTTTTAISKKITEVEAVPTFGAAFLALGEEREKTVSPEWGAITATLVTTMTTRAEVVPNSGAVATVIAEYGADEALLVSSRALGLKEGPCSMAENWANRAKGKNWRKQANATASVKAEIQWPRMAMLVRAKAKKPRQTIEITVRKTTRVSLSQENAASNMAGEAAPNAGAGLAGAKATVAARLVDQLTNIRMGYLLMTVAPLGSKGREQPLKTKLSKHNLHLARLKRGSVTTLAGTAIRGIKGVSGSMPEKNRPGCAGRTYERCLVLIIWVTRRTKAL
mmetsp:Transcript_40701/g.122582  ORF Transcript_40701/g.122582 Transcript_40701/m.122582 type:complete len:282 (-) Transcript_40701:2568-3413(-)